MSDKTIIFDDENLNNSNVPSSIIFDDEKLDDDTIEEDAIDTTSNVIVFDDDQDDVTVEEDTTTKVDDQVDPMALAFVDPDPAEVTEDGSEITPDTGYFAKPKEDTFGGGPSEFVGSAVGAILSAPFQAAEFVGQLVAPETTKAITDTITDIDEKLKIKSPAYRATIDELQGASLGEMSQELSRIPSYFIGGKLFKEGAQRGVKALTKSDKGKKTVGLFGAGTGAVVADVFTRREDETHIGDIAKIVNDADIVENEYLKKALELSSELSIDPSDTAVQKRVKQFQESIAAAGLTTGAIKTILLTFKYTPKVLKFGLDKLKAKKQAIDDDILDEIPDATNARITSSEVVETIPERGKDVEYKQRNKVTQIIGKVNTKLGRIFSNTAALPKEIYKAAIERSRADKAFTLSVKDNVEQLQKAQKDDGVSDEALSKYINNNIDDGLSEGVRKKADEIKTLIADNEYKINKMLGLKGKNQVGLGFNDGDVYFTRSFEANNNPKFLKEINKAIEGESMDADFIRRVEGARRYFRSLNVNKDGTPSMTDDEVDGAIKVLVQRLAGKSDDSSLINKIWNDADGNQISNLSNQAAKVLKARKKLDKPILDLLGERKDPYAKISSTLTNQNRLMSEISYLSQVDSFFKKNAGKEVELGGLVPKLLGGARDTTGVKFGAAGSRETDSLYDLSKNSIGRFGGSSNMLKDIYVSPQMYNYVKNGLDLFDPKNRSSWLNGSIGRMLSQVSAFGQATQTILDIPAYAINTYGAFQSLASNGLLFNPKNAIAAKDAVLLMSEQLKTFRNDNKFTKAAIRKLERLKSKGVIDTDLTSEMISNNINVYGKDISSRGSKAGRAYSKFMEKASAAYGAPDTYAKLVAFEAEYAILKKTFPRMKGESAKAFDDRIFDMAADRVRDTMPSYAVASPIARTLSRLPIGTYALFPSEMVRTTKNTLKYGVSDTLKGLASGNVRQVASGIRRLTGLGVTATGVDYYINNNNEQLGVTPITDRVLTVLAPDWGKNSKRLHSQGLVKDEDGIIRTRYINSASIDAQDYMKVPARAIVGKLLAGEKVSDFELNEVMKGMVTSVVGPYTNPKFVYEGIYNILQKDFYSDVPEEQGFSTENFKRAALEIAKTLEPGTSQAVRRYIQALTSEEIRETGKGINRSGFPQTSDDVETWLTTGVRPVTVDVKKAMGFNLSKDIKSIKSTRDAFIQYLGKLDDQPYTSALRQDILNKYKNLQDKKFRAMQKLSDKVDLFKQTPYEELKTDKKTGDAAYEDKEFGLATVLDAATSGFMYDVPDEILYANTLREGLKDPKGGVFVADDLSNDQGLFNLIQNKSFKNTLISDLAKEYGRYTGRKLKE